MVLPLQGDRTITGHGGGVFDRLVYNVLGRNHARGFCPFARSAKHIRAESEARYIQRVRLHLMSHIVHARRHLTVPLNTSGSEPRSQNNSQIWFPRVCARHIGVWSTDVAADLGIAPILNELCISSSEHHSLPRLLVNPEYLVLSNAMPTYCNYEWRITDSPSRQAD